MRRLILAACILTPSLLAQQPAYLNTTLTPEARAHDLVARMTLEEKAAQSMNSAPAIPRLNIPAYDYWNEGLHGIARSGYSTLFPQAIGMAATWDAPLLHGMGDTVSTEARAKYNEAIRHNIHSIYFGLTVWSPNINIFRDPRWGRGQETYGEDPFLTATLGFNFIEGLQGPDPEHPRVVATPKHYAVHSGPEAERHRFDVTPTPHDLWDTYLPQFRAAIVDAHADSIMCAYNSVDGQPACASDLLLKEVLRGDWHFGGFVTSDCGAIDDFFEKNAHHYSPDKAHAAALGILQGTDTNCGQTYAALPDAVHQGLLKESDIDIAVERLFTWRMRLGLFDPVGSHPYDRIPFSEDRSPAHLALSRKASRESIVLLKNDGILPLAPGKYKRIAVVGPTAASLAAIEGNYNAIPKDPVMPVDALRRTLASAHITYGQGASFVDGTPLPVPSSMLRPSTTSTAHGLKAEYFRGNGITGTPVATRIDHQIDFDWNSAAPVPGTQQDAFAVRWSGTITPLATGDTTFTLRLAHCYPCSDFEHIVVTVDGKQVDLFDNPGKEFRPVPTPNFTVHFADLNPHPIEVTYTHKSPLFGAGLTLEWVPPTGALQTEAARLAANSDLVIAMIGLSPELEGEETRFKADGFSNGDRLNIDLPASQQQLLDALAATGKPIVVVVLNGSALALNWAQQHANAIVEAWYPGEFGGDSIASTLTGGNNPSGRLPITFYRSTSDLPAFTDYAMKDRTYRYFTGTPLYSFGFGLSYTHFTYTALHLSTTNLHAGDPLTAEVTVTNSGHRAGDEVAEAYLTPPAGANDGLSPRLQLIAFQRVTLAPGQSRRIKLTFAPRTLSEVDANGNRSVQPGNYTLSLGGAQPNDPNAPAKPLTAQFSITGTLALPK